MRLNIYHLYPELLDLYADGGNITTLAARCRWRGIKVEIREVSLGEELDFSQADILFFGGGSGKERNLLMEDLNSRASELKLAIEDGLVVLAIGGDYQLLGKYYQTDDGRRIPGLGILDIFTVAGDKRLVGNVIVEMDTDLRQAVLENYTNGQDQGFGHESLNTLVGFENHLSKTYLGSDLKPLGKVLKGYGNNGEDFLEGTRYKNVFMTCLHGPLLPKNPHLADLLLGLALRRKGYVFDLLPLEDFLEKAAHRAVISRFKDKK
jgi:CobQ-like glutamine amidotransferase family enzyme